MLMRQFHLFCQTTLDIVHIVEFFSNIICHGDTHTDTSPGLCDTIMVRCPCVMLQFCPSSSVFPM